MKTSLKSFFVIIFSSLSSFCAESIGIINDTFFTSPDTIVTFRTLVPHNDGYMAIIDGSDTIGNKTISVAPFFTKNWSHDDKNKESTNRIDATILCGTRTLEKSLTISEKVPYLFIRDVEDKSGELSLECPVTFYKMKEFKRPDDTIFRLAGDPIYHLEMKELRIGASDVAVCVKEWVITSQWQRKTRHARRHYSAIDVYHITTKVPVTTSLTLTPSASPEELTRVFVKKELRFKSYDAESPECGNNGGNLPAGAVII